MLCHISQARDGTPVAGTQYVDGSGRIPPPQRAHGAHRGASCGPAVTLALGLNVPLDRPYHLTMCRQFAVLVALVLLTLASRVHAQCPETTARQRSALLRDAGVAHAAGVEADRSLATHAAALAHYARAIELTQAALALCDTPAARYALAHAEYRAGRTADAQRDARACASASPPELAEACRVLLARVPLATDPVETGTLAPFPFAPGPQAPRETAPRARSGPGEGPGEGTASARPSRGSQGPSRAPSRVPSAGPPGGALALLTVGSVGVVTGVVLHVVRANALAPCTVSGDVATCPDSETLQAARAAPGLALGGNLALGVGLAAAAGGLAWWAFGGSREAPVALAVGPGGVGVSGRW